jgi:heat shock protein HtpX
MARQRVIGPDDPKYPAIRRRLFWTSVKTILGYLAMGGLLVGALKLFHLHLSVIYGFGLIWVFLPVVMWWISAWVALKMAKAEPADVNNPEHKRVIDIVHRLFAKSGLGYEPPVYASPDESPNAFATGPIHRKAVVAFTAGLLKIGLTDEEIEAVFAHELSHVKHYDVGINSLLSVISSILFMVVQAGINGVAKIFLPKEKRQQFVGSIVNSVIFYAVFWVISQITRVIQMFVVRSRESAADAGGALMTGNPCALATALQKLVNYVETHRPAQGHQDAYWRAMRPIMTIDPLYDSLAPDPQPTGLWAWLKHMWKELQATHPPVPERIAELEKMNGGACPVVPKDQPR